MTNLWFSTLLVLLSACVSFPREEGSSSLQDIIPKELEQIKRGPQARTIDKTITTVFPHLRPYWGHWLLANGSIHVIISGIPPLPYETQLQSMILDSFVWNQSLSIWQRQTQIPPVSLGLGSDKAALQPHAIKATQTEEAALLDIRYEDSSGKGGNISYSIGKENPVIVLAFKDFPKSFPVPKLQLWNHLEPSFRRQDGFVNVSHEGESLSLISPPPAPIYRSPTATSMSIENPLQKVLVLFGSRGDELSSFLWDKAPTCLQQELTALWTCLGDGAQTSLVSISAPQGDWDLSILGESQEFLGRLFVRKGDTKTLPLRRTKVSLKARDKLIAHLAINKDVEIKGTPIPDPQLPRLEKKPNRKSQYAYSEEYQDPHGLVFQVLSKKRLGHFDTLWRLFYEENKGPKTFLFPKFVRYQFPSSLLVVRCSDTNINLRELTLYVGAAKPDQIDLTTCNSQQGREQFVTLYKELERSQRSIQLSSDDVFLEEKIRSPQEVAGSMETAEGIFHFSIVKQKQFLSFSGQFKPAMSFEAGYSLVLTDSNRQILYTKDLAGGDPQSQQDIKDASKLRTKNGVRVEIFRRTSDRGLIRRGTSPLYMF